MSEQEQALLSSGDPDTLRVALAGHPFCADLDVEHVRALSETASERELPAGGFVLRRGQPAAALTLLLDGDVSLELTEPGDEPIVLETLHGGDPVGWSWLFPPHRWAFDARCLTPVRLLQLDAAQLRTLMSADPVFGLALTQRIGQLVVQRLQFTRAQLVEITHHDRA
ncbi:MAG: cyclic nucleotide-binding domain-containing protein [Nitriliruptoraceae bacterium]